MRSIINKVRQLNFSVSETEPIKISTAAYSNCGESGYDMHFGLELGIVLSGVIRRHYLEHSRLVGRGQVWFCGMWEPHGFEVVNAPCTVIVLIIWPPMLAQLRLEEAPELKWMAPFTVKPSARPQITFSKKKSSLDQAFQLKGLIASSTPVEKARIRICLLNILTMVLNSCPEFKVKKINLGPEHWSRLNHTMQLVFESCSFVSTSQAAKACGLDRNVFSRLFEKWMGIRFADFALRFRLKSGADQLLNRNDPVKAVARRWGFVDTSHFHRVFQKHYGYSPSEFRRFHSSQK